MLANAHCSRRSRVLPSTVITRGRHKGKGKNPSLPTLYRTLAEAAAQRADT
ncbi:hypothetical protein [Streptomyces sp. AGS-58]|uniref:hypothetical protein n=1 Tax=unclassified Streptomyces TaxID=2593676 RepID=UPI0035A2CA97